MTVFSFVHNHNKCFVWMVVNEYEIFFSFCSMNMNVILRLNFYLVRMNFLEIIFFNAIMSNDGKIC